MVSRTLGVLLALVTGVVLLVEMLFAVPSMLRYRRIRAM